MPSFTDNSSSDAGQRPSRKYSSTGGGSYPQLGDLVGELIMIDPVKIEQVTDDFAKPGPDGTKPLKPRLTADVVVLTGQNAGSYDGMWFGQNGFVSKAQTILDKRAAGRPGADDELMLGRLRRMPKKDVKKHYGDHNGLEAAIRRGDRVPGTDYFWLLADGDTRADDIELAENYHASGAVADAPVDEDDPFEDD